MIKQIVMLSILVMLVTTQTTVNPKTQGCACSNLLSQADCQAKSGCQWTATNTTNSTNSTSSTNTSSTSSTPGGTCGVAVTTTVTYPTYCGQFNQTDCPNKIGCAWLNNTCQIFTGCTAYVNTTNALCQSISSQCTTDTTKCIPIAQCSTYTKSQQQCEGNVGSLQPYKCKWTASGTSGTCAELTCKDAPTTYTTLKQCQSWISNCLSNGAGCDTALGTCSTYKVADNCVGRIGSDGNCGKPTDSNAVNCVALSCSDAPKTTAYNTDAACVAFQPIKTCVTTQKGCFDSPLPQCSNFKKTDTCTDFKGSDGWCTDDTTTATTTTCRALKCSDAQFTTNDACKAAVKGLTCTSNGLTCVDSPQNCEQYTDTNANCLNYVGSNGKCKGTGTTETAKASCAARVCKEAPNTLKDDNSCNSYKTGCVTTGAGCIDVLQPCNTYTGTATTCVQYKGSDGNCYAPTSQTTDGSCQAKQCADADKTFTQNSQCQTYSYLCYTNGQGCTALTKCEEAQLATTCQGNNSCSSVNNLCLNVSDCSNFKTQSQCLLNNQIYKPSGSTTSYTRKCYWSNGSCSNIACSEIATKLNVNQADLKDLQTCKAKLDGCLYGGDTTVGCVDVNDDCTKYKGTATTCILYQGSQGKDQCITKSTTLTNCEKKVCSLAHNQATSIPSKQEDCTAFQSSGCYYDGSGKCTSGDCSTYNLGSECSKLTTAKNPDGTKQDCVYSGSGTACRKKQCSDITDASACQNYSLCAYDGTKCVDTTSQTCDTYTGTQDQCQKFSFKPATLVAQSCTKLTKICKSFTTCAAHLIPASLTQDKDKSLDCQLVYDSTSQNNCRYDSDSKACNDGSTCDKYVTALTGAAAQQYCSKLKTTEKCWWSSGNNCSKASKCTDFTIISNTSNDDSAAICKNLTPDGTNYCGFIIQTTTPITCSARSCSDYGIGATQTSDCTNYLSTCDGYSALGFCYTQLATCNLYTIDGITYNNTLKKTQFCSSLIGKTGTAKCTYDQSTDKCLAAEDCAQVTFTSTSSPPDTEKQDVCANAQDKTGNKCGFKAGAGACQVLQDDCSKYAPISATNNADRQTSCQKFRNKANETCNFLEGASTCNDYLLPTPALLACTGYKTYQATDDLNLKYCANLVFVSGGTTTQCGYSSTSAGSCKAFACSDLSQANCKNYSACVYSGVSCIDKKTNCVDYNIDNSVLDKLSYCKQLTNQASKQCGFSASNSSKCSDRACTDLASSDSYQTCQSYLSTCTYDGSKCVTSLDCTTITPTGTTDSDKATFCNKLGDGKACTFVTGGAKCSTTVAGCTYPIPTLAFAYAQAACSLTQDNAGNKCGYVKDQTCSARSCTNAIQASTTQDCINWLPGCDLDKASSCAEKKLF